MPLETATYISDLVTTNPAASDGMNQADDHMRLIKSAVKTTFPNVTGAVTATQAQLNAMQAWSTAGVPLLAHAGTFFDNGAGAASTDGFLNTLAGDIDVQLQGNLAFTFQRTGGANFFKANGNIEAVGGTLKGGGMCPIGSILIWPSNTLPPTDEGVFAWCNGATASRTTYATAYARVGTTFGVGDGSTTFGLPDYREVVLMGRATMGSSTQRNLLGQFTQTVKDTLSAWFGEATHIITGGELPAHRHPVALGDAGHSHGGVLVSTNSYSSPGGATAVVQSANGGSTAVSTTGMTISDGAGTFNATGITGASGAMSLVQPTQPTNYIIRLA